MASQSTKNDLELIELMIEYCEAIQSDLTVVENDIELFIENEVIQRSCSFSLVQIGEYTKRLSDELRSKYKTIHWSGIAGLRDIIVHRYERVETKVLWDTITIDVPILEDNLKMIEKELKR